MSAIPVLIRFRISAAAMAAVTAVFICIAQHHVHVVLYEPYTYASLFAHKCGLLMIGCVIWAMLELTRYSASRRWQPVSSTKPELIE